MKKPYTKKQLLQYRANIAAIKKILSGRSQSLASELKKKMNALAHKRRYEEAQTARDQLWSIERIFEHRPYLKRDTETEREKALITLKELLGLKQIPARIEGYDISHHHGDTAVGSMVVFENAKPQKNEYRKFIIRSVGGIDDTASLREVLTRRLKHPEWPVPDLFLIDGGKAQLNAAAKALAERNTVLRDKETLRGALASLAKREEELYIAGKKDPLPLKKLPQPLLHLLTHVRDEAHRFAISFHRKRKSRLARK